MQPTQRRQVYRGWKESRLQAVNLLYLISEAGAS